MSKNCYRCNAQINDDTAFCPSCGAIQKSANISNAQTAGMGDTKELTSQMQPQGMQMQGAPMNQMPPQGMQMQGAPMNQMPPQGMQMQGTPINQMPPQGAQMQGNPDFSMSYQAQTIPPKGGKAPRPQKPPKPPKDNGGNEGNDGKKRGRGAFIGVMIVLFAMLMIFAGVMYYYFGIHKKNIDLVKNTEAQNHVTYSEAFDGYFKDTNWKYFKNDSGDKIVEFSGTRKINKDRVKISVQFTVDDGDVFASYCEVNGEPVSKNYYYVIESFVTYAAYDSGNDGSACDIVMKKIVDGESLQQYILEDGEVVTELTTEEVTTEATTEATTAETTTEATTEEEVKKCPYDYEQKVVVSVSSASSTSGTLELLEWDNGEWVSRFSCYACVGKSGIGSDYGEGKNITPMGVFKLGTILATREIDNGMDCMIVSATTCVVDDVSSELYNIITDTRSVPSEVSCDKIGNNIVNGNLSAAIFIEHNGDGHSSKNVVPGKGSVITICGCQGSVNPTAGCVDISSSDLDRLFGLLDGTKKPVIEITIK